MKNILIAISFISVSVFGQLKTEEVTPFYNESDEVILSADMVSNGFDPVMVYVSSKGLIQGKKLNKDKWEFFGSFPNGLKGDLVKLKYWNNTYHAMVRGADGWSVFIKDNDATKWTLFGKENFAPAASFLNPEIMFLEDNLMIFEHHPETGVLTIYDQVGQDLVFRIAGEYVGKEKVASDFNYVSNSLGESVLTYKSEDKFKVFKLKKDEGIPKSFSGGVDTKGIKSLVGLGVRNDEIYYVYLSYIDKLEFRVCGEGSKSWKRLTFGQTTNSLKFSFSREMSFVTVPEANEQPEFYYCENNQWAPGVKLNLANMDNKKPVILRKVVGKFYLLYFDVNGKAVVQTIDNY